MPGDSEQAMRSWLERLAARHPLLAAALVTVAGVALADVHGLWGGTVVVLLAAIGTWKVGWRCGLIWLVCGALATGVFLWRDWRREAAGQLLIGRPVERVRAVVLKDGRGSGRFWSAPARLLTGPGRGTKVWWEGQGEAPVAGAVVSARGTCQVLQEPRNPGEFNRAEWLRRQGVAARFEAMGGSATVETGALARLSAQIRKGFRAAVTAGLDEESEAAQVIRAVVIGEQPADADALIAAFRNSGTLHVFSVSGLHVAMVGSLGWLVLGRLGVPRRTAVLGLIPLVFGYAWITGHSAPAVRSAWMAAVFLGAFVFRRKPDLLNALGAVLLVAMCWDGRVLFQPGVQLSYGVVAAIACGTALASRAFSWLAETEPLRPESLLAGWRERWLNLRRWLAQSLAVSLAAGLGSMPLTAFHFGLVTPVSIVASVALVPLVFVLLAVALLAAAIHPLAPPVARGINRLNGLVAGWSVRTAEVFSAVPGGHLRIRHPGAPRLIVYDLDYGAGAACFSGGRDGAALIDCGDRRGFRQTVLPSLRTLGIEPDSVVLTHPDGNHLGGGSTVWQALPVRQALLPVPQARSPSFREWLEDAPTAGIRVSIAGETDRLEFPDGAWLEVLQVPDPLARDALADERVAVYRLHWRGWRILFASDAGLGTELRMLDGAVKPDADVIVAGRHRSDLTLSDRFLDAVDPQVIVASNAPYPDSERLPRQAADYWQERGIAVFDQAVTGAVTLTVDEAGRLVVDGYLGAVRQVFTRR